MSLLAVAHDCITNAVQACLACGVVGLFINIGSGFRLIWLDHCERPTSIVHCRQPQSMWLVDLFKVFQIDIWVSDECNGFI